MPTIYVILASGVTLGMAAVTVVGFIRWARLDLGGRLIVVAIAVHLAMALGSLTIVLLGYRTRLFQEVPQLIGTLLTLLGFRAWQPEAWQRRAVSVGIVALAVGWVVAQYLQGRDALFSTIASPLHATFICAAAGLTMVTRVRITAGRWTGQLWYWFAVGLLIDYGTEVLLVPVVETAFGTRSDLVFIPSYIHLVGGIVGYGLMTWGVWQLRTPIGVAGFDGSVYSTR